jgi:hypothetical protein
MLAPMPAAAQEATPPPEQVTVTLKDGNHLVGTVVTEDESALTLRTPAGVELRLVRDAIATVSSERTASLDDRPLLSDPNLTRLMFAPTGRPLGKGDGYFSDHYVVFPGFAYGLTRNLTLAGGVSTIPGIGLDEQAYYVSAQVGFQRSAKAAFALGGLYAAAGGEEDLNASVLYGVATLGPAERSLTLGFGLGANRNAEYYYDDRGSYTHTAHSWSAEPILLVGGNVRLSRRTSLLSENWLFLDRPISEQAFGLALRLLADRISVDVGVVLVPEALDEGFPIPWLSFSYHFGPARSDAKARPALRPAGLASRRTQR